MAAAHVPVTPPCVCRGASYILLHLVLVMLVFLTRLAFRSENVCDTESQCTVL